ncbi:bifunctional riboflavin kinase/FAD synthetase [Clostridium cellulovorans]|uniref:Riboflavin biosynthesis protein n=1 Tax=Clostridium cellulovorans (strain ATCC 35296 / DSM 3052 / OCM 3 / 743B) TaxID=573061 RepID=D9SKP0_CLOC7|nr:bifunctional riboflavin kinase/FAD synthetase [Clostridium cellulovorans]ADL51536.1 riboflavin biosynthesis protein RibF [Clostridium cellulovorans 743B]
MRILNDNFHIDLEDSTYITLGSFDGLHMGHQQLIKSTVSKARENNIKSMVYTFSNHPLSILAPDKEPKQLMVNEKKIEILKKLEVDIVNFAHFNEEYLKIQPVAFIELLVKKYNMKGIVVGYNNRFGYKNQGDVELLKAYSNEYGYEVIVIDPVKEHDTIVSSTKIRAFITEGEVEKASVLLGRPYSLEGKVVSGKHLGNTIGFPTANIEINFKRLLPKGGVYYSNVKVENKIYKGITNIGYNPTVQGDSLSVETHILDFNQSIYDEFIEVYFVKRIRDEKKFKSIDELVKQLKQDKAYAEKFNFAVK